MCIEHASNESIGLISYPLPWSQVYGLSWIVIVAVMIILKVRTNLKPSSYLNLSSIETIHCFSLDWGYLLPDL